MAFFSPKTHHVVPHLTRASLDYWKHSAQWSLDSEAQQSDQFSLNANVLGEV